MENNKRLKMDRFDLLMSGLSVTQERIMLKANKVIEQEKKKANFEKRITAREIINTIQMSNYFKTYVRIVENVDKKLIPKESLIYGIEHNYRLSILMAYLGINQKVSEKEFMILINAALYLDIGRKGEGKESAHGTRSSKLIKEMKFEALTDEDIVMLRAIVAAHSVSDDKIEEIIDMYGVKRRSRVRKLIAIVKDAKDLEKVRFERGVDTKTLRMRASKKMVIAAYEIYANINTIQTFNQEKWTSIKDYIKLVSSFEYKINSYNATKSINANDKKTIKSKFDVITEYNVLRPFNIYILNKELVRIMFDNKDMREETDEKFKSEKLVKGEKFDGTEFTTIDKAVRWLLYGDTLYHIELPRWSVVKEVHAKDTNHGLLETESIIIKDGVKMTDKIAMTLYKKSVLHEKAYYRTLAAAAIMGYKSTARTILRDKINEDNVEEAIKEYTSYVVIEKKSNYSSENINFYKEILKAMEKIRDSKRKITIKKGKEKITK